MDQLNEIVHKAGCGVVWCGVVVIVYKTYVRRLILDASDTA